MNYNKMIVIGRLHKFLIIFTHIICRSYAFFSSLFSKFRKNLNIRVCFVIMIDGVNFGGDQLNTLNKVLIGIWVTSLFVLFAFFFQWLKEDDLDIVQTSEAEQTEVPLPESPIVEEVVIPKETIEFGMIGDVLLHLRLAKYQDYMSSFSAVQPMLERVDYLVANQESPPTGPAFALSGYPRFSSPEHIIRDIQNVGIDMVVLANNHIVDKGEAGMTQVFKNIDKYEMPYVGAYRSQEDADDPRIIDIKGIKIAMLAYTYGTNGLYLPKGSPYVVNYIDDAKMTSDIAAIQDSVDVVAVSIHWGPEYVTQENAEQNRLAKVLNDAGADIVFGSHPHILQPYEKLTSEAGQETHVFYSISNFFATILTVPDTMIGGIASFEITKEGETVTIDKPKFVATSNLLDSDGVYRVYPLADVEHRSVRNLQWVQSVLGPDVLVQ